MKLESLLETPREIAISLVAHGGQSDECKCLDIECPGYNPGGCDCLRGGKETLARAKAWLAANPEPQA